MPERGLPVLRRLWPLHAACVEQNTRCRLRRRRPSSPGDLGVQLRSARERHWVSALLGGRASHHSLSFMRRRPPPLPTFLAVYGLAYAAFGVQSPFLPALFREQGMRAEEIGIVLAASTALRVFAGPAVGHIADRLRRHTATLCACSFVAAVAGLGYVMIQSFAGLLLVALVQAATLAPIVPISDALATTAARRSLSGEGRRFEYGWLRASGSAAFIVGTMPPAKSTTSSANSFSRH